MRPLTLLCAFGACLVASAQQAPAPSLFLTVKPQGTVVVRKHPNGSEVVEVTMLDAKYPLDLLKQQASAIASQMGQEAQGLFAVHYQLQKDTPDLVFSRAQFGVKGLSDPAKGIYRLEPIAKAFAGAAEPYTISGLAVVFQNQLPGPNTLQKYDDAAVAVELSPQAGQIGVEYRIALKSQDPSKIVIPEGRPQKKAPIVEKPKPKSDWVLIGFGILAALALGALVYSLLSRVRPQSGPSPR